MKNRSPFRLRTAGFLKTGLVLAAGFILCAAPTTHAQTYTQVDNTAAPQRIQLSQSLPPLQTAPGYNNGGYQMPAYQQPQASYNQAPLQGHVITAPAGTYLSASVTQPVSSEFARVGDRFSAMLGTPINSGGSVLIPAGSQLEGQVVMVRPAGRTGRHGELDVRFTSAMLPNGQRVPLSARLQTEDNRGILIGGSTKERVGKAALNTAVGAGLGAALGTAMGPLSGGEVGRGAIYGTAVGAGLGGLKAAWNKGEEAVLQAGQPVNIVLDQPLTMSPSQPAAQQGYSQPYGNLGGYDQYQQPYGQQSQYGY